METSLLTEYNPKPLHLATEIASVHCCTFQIIEIKVYSSSVGYYELRPFGGWFGQLTLNALSGEVRVGMSRCMSDTSKTFLTKQCRYFGNLNDSSLRYDMRRSSGKGAPSRQVVRRYTVLLSAMFKHCSTLLEGQVHNIVVASHEE